MPYPALPAARRRHFEIDGSIVGWNNTSISNGLSTIASAGQMLQLNEETPTVDANVIGGFGNGVSVFVYWLFPELVDLSFFIFRWINVSGTSVTGVTLQSSVDTTTGVDGTWLTVGTGAGSTSTAVVANDWWRSSAPAALTSNNTSIKALRMSVTTSSGNNNNFIRNTYLWGTKHSGQTPNDILFLGSDGITEWAADDDWGDVQAGSGFVVHTYYIKNSASSLTANTITVKSSGSDSAQWTVSLDNVSFASSKSIASLAPGATQVFYVKYTPAAQSAGNLRPYASFIEADVVSWS